MFTLLVFLLLIAWFVAQFHGRRRQKWIRLRFGLRPVVITIRDDAKAVARYPKERRLRRQFQRELKDL